MLVLMVMMMIGFKDVDFLFNSVGMILFDLCCGFCSVLS